MTLALPRPSPLAPLARLAAEAPAMTAAGLILAAASLPLAWLAATDPVALDGEPVWLKPLKFALSLSLYTLTLAWAARHIPATSRNRPAFRVFTFVVIGAIALEMAWIVGGAAMDVRSHWNFAYLGRLWVYPLMGAAAVTLTSGALGFGVAILRARPDPSVRLIGWSLVATFPLTVPIAGTLSGIEGGVIGTPSALTVPLFGWSLRGDLHPAHFLAVHTMQVAPVAAFVLGPRPWILPAWVAMTLAAFAWAFV